jgi:hypothetical protein
MLMSDVFGITPIGQHGGRRPGAGRPRKGEVRPPKPERFPNVLNSGDHGYLLRRLARDAQHGCKDAATLLQGVRDGLISAYTAGVEMNYTRRREPNGRGSGNAARTRDWTLHRLFYPRPDKGRAPPGGANGA